MVNGVKDLRSQGFTMSGGRGEVRGSALQVQGIRTGVLRGQESVTTSDRVRWLEGFRT